MGSPRCPQHRSSPASKWITPTSYSGRSQSYPTGCYLWSTNKTSAFKKEVKSNKTVTFQLSQSRHRAQEMKWLAFIIVLTSFLPLSFLCNLFGDSHEYCSWSSFPWRPTHRHTIFLFVYLSFWWALGGMGLAYSVVLKAIGSVLGSDPRKCLGDHIWWLDFKSHIRHMQGKCLTSYIISRALFHFDQA